MMSDVTYEGFDEAHDEAGAPRPGYAPLLEALAAIDLDALRIRAARVLERDGVGFADDPFVIDPIPRIITGAEWAALAAGLAQRLQALNYFLLDAYGRRDIVSAGIIDAVAIERAEGYEPDLLERLPPDVPPVGIAGFDVVRAPSGEFLVLEDNLRTPSGISYAIAARRAVAEVLPPGLPRPRPIHPHAYELLGAVLRASAPAAAPAGDPFIIVLTDGPDNVAYYEHAEIARHLDAPLLTPGDLHADSDGLHACLPAGGERQVDVVYRRTDEDRVRESDGSLTPVAELLLPAWLSGRIGLVNAFGNGLGDDKLIHRHVEDFVRFYLGDEPIIRSVPTDEVDPPDEVGELRDLVVKPRHGHGGKGVVIGTHAGDDDLDELAAELELWPERYIAQPVVPLSCHPTVVGDGLELRHVDLRPFAYAAGDETIVLPGGLTRVALDAGALIVNSSQSGGGKDTWVLD
jgi:carboxylate-amine ligase